jgi:hypothetical protein
VKEDVVEADAKMDYGLLLVVQENQGIANVP